VEAHREGKRATTTHCANAARVDISLQTTVFIAAAKEVRRMNMVVRCALLTCALLMSACQGSIEGGGVATISSGLPSAVSSDPTSAPLTFPAARNCQHVGVLLPDSRDVKRWELRDRPKLAAELQRELPNAKIDIANAEGDSDKQLEQATTMLAQGACVLIVAPQNSSKASTIVELAAQRGVPVVAYERAIDDDRVAYRVTFDGERIGQMQGEWIVQNAPKGAKVALINGPEHDRYARALADGVMKQLRPAIDRGDLTLAFELNAPNWSINSVQSSVTQLYAAQSQLRDVRVIYAANDDMANSVIGALQQANLAGEVIVVGQDATIESARNIVSGLQGATIYKDPDWQASQAARLIGMLSRGEDPDVLVNSQIALPSGRIAKSIVGTPVLVHRDNAKSVLIDSGVVSLAEVCGTGANRATWCP
jgi:D-xylose transport system substrate-binding protein